MKDMELWLSVYYAFEFENCLYLIVAAFLLIEETFFIGTVLVL